jgi:hypothetical protein
MVLIGYDPLLIGYEVLSDTVYDQLCPVRVGLVDRFPYGRTNSVGPYVRTYGTDGPRRGKTNSVGPTRTGPIGTRTDPESAVPVWTNSSIY